MKTKMLLNLLLCAAFALTGCAKKVTEDTTAAGTGNTGLDSVSTSEELAQLPHDQQQPATAAKATAKPVAKPAARPAGARTLRHADHAGGDREWQEF